MFNTLILIPLGCSIWGYSVHIVGERKKMCSAKEAVSNHPFPLETQGKVREWKLLDFLYIVCLPMNLLWGLRRHNVKQTALDAVQEFSCNHKPYFLNYTQFPWFSLSKCLTQHNQVRVLIAATVSIQTSLLKNKSSTSVSALARMSHAIERHLTTDRGIPVLPQQVSCELGS